MKFVSRRSFLFILTSLALMFSSFGVNPVYAATLTVTNTNNSGPGSLRNAIANANSGDIVNFDPALSGATITLSTTLTISDDITIDASALSSHITISGNYNVRVFDVGPGTIVTLNSLKIYAGKDPLGGGGIHNHGALTVQNCIFYGNITTELLGTGGAAIANNDGALFVLNSSFEQNYSATSGGAIWSDRPITVVDSSFVSNAAQMSGGAILTNSPLVSDVKNSTFYNNSATGGGGAIYNGSAALLRVTNSTFSQNHSPDGGGIYNSGTIEITNSTLFGSASVVGGIYSSGVLNYANTIIANPDSGSDCEITGGGSIGTNTNNLVEDGSCSASLSGDPMLASLAANGGPTATLALLAGSPAIDAGDDGVCFRAPVFDLDQRGVVRPQGAHCDIGAYELTDFTAPIVLSITRASSNPSDAASVDYIVNFSEPVIDVDISDFTVTKVGAGNITDMSVSGVSGSDDTYTVTVSTGNGTGRIRLDVLASGDITDLVGYPLANLPYQSGDIYAIVRADIFRTNGSQDGWILESSQNSGVGGTLNAAAPTLIIGDDAQNRQFAAILSFDTSALPNNAVVTDIKLRIKRQGSVVGTIATLGGPNVDIKSNMFGALPDLELGDYGDMGDAVETLDTFDLQSGNWYLANLNSIVYPYVNLTGITQFRVYFLDDNGNGVSDFVKFFSGDTAAISNRPQLIIQYSVMP